MINVAMFDIGGVILDSERDFQHIYDDFGERVGLPEGKSRELHFKYLKPMLNGDVSAKQFFAIIKKEFPSLRNKDLEEVWTDVALKEIYLNKDLLRVLTKLRKTIKVVALSNVTETRAFVDKKMNVYDHFDELYLSYKLGMVKPNKNIFQYTLKKLKVKADEVVFVDDKESNLVVSRALGIKSIQFNNTAQLVNEFERLGLL